MTHRSWFVQALGLLAFAFLAGGCNLDPDRWKTGLNPEGKKPFDTQALVTLTPGYYGVPRPELVKEPFFDRFVYDMPAGSLYIALGTYPQFDSLSSELLLEFVEKGNTALIGANQLPPMLLDALKLEITEDGLYLTEQNKDSVDVKVRGQAGYFRFPKKNLNHFKEDKNGACLASDDNGRCFMAEAKIGAGRILLLTQPEWLSNYHLMRPKGRKFAEHILAYAGQPSALYMDGYYFKKRIPPPPPNPNRPSPLAYILQQRGLREAFLLAALGILAYFLMAFRRKQRIIPVIPPKANTSLEFAQTIGRLYFRSGNHHNLAEKRFKAWFDYLRVHYRLHPGKDQPPVFVQQVAAKSGVGEDLVASLLASHRRLSNTTAITEEELTTLSGLLDEFYSLTRTTKPVETGKTSQI